MEFITYDAEEVTKDLPPHNDNPTYLTLIPNSYVSITAFWNSRKTDSGQWKNGYIAEALHYSRMTSKELQLVLLTAILLTVARYMVTKFIAMVRTFL